MWRIRRGIADFLAPAAAGLWLLLLLQAALTQLATALSTRTPNRNSYIPLSPIERVLLQDRLEGIKASIGNQYSNQIRENKVNTFIFPGAGGVDELVEELQSELSSSNKNNKFNDVTTTPLIVDWKEQRGSILTAGYDSEAVGESIAMCVDDDDSSDTELKVVHYIGISVGGFAANAAARWTCQQQDPSSEVMMEVRLTLLDPFCGRGLTGPNYGRDNFGIHGTTAIHLLNTDDPVPTTNDPLPNCFTVDVTQAAERNKFIPPPGDSMHSWPLAYFTRYFDESKFTVQRGTVVQV